MLMKLNILSIKLLLCSNCSCDRHVGLNNNVMPFTSIFLLIMFRACLVQICLACLVRFQFSPILYFLRVLYSLLFSLE